MACMGIRQKNGKLEYRFQLHGRPVQVLTDLADTPRNRQRAAAMEAEHRERIQRELMTGQRLAARISFSDAQAMFIKAAEHEYTKDATVRRIKTSFTSANLFFGTITVCDIQPGHVERYALWRASEHEVRPITIRHDLHALSLFFQWAERHGYHTSNPVEGVPIPSDRDAIRQHILTPEEEADYFNGARNKDDGKIYKANGTLRDVARLILLQGLRPAEVLQLRKEDVNLTAGTVTVVESKTAAGRRTLYLCEESRQILARLTERKKESPYCFPSPDDPQKPILKVNGAHDRLCAKINANWVLYDLRHTFATRMKELGVDDFALAAILGHASPRTLPRYVHPTQQHQFEAMKRYAAAVAKPQEKECQNNNSPSSKGGPTSS